MKIKSLSIMNFAGLKGKHTYDFPSIIALCAKNGSGKTSYKRIAFWTYRIHS